ncbi:MAG: hypothetical protein K1000chlam4_00141 [Chlamydiae bacterium]|nr:hypothetical protein [Chlamydiota bacterium]
MSSSVTPSETNIQTWDNLASEVLGHVFQYLTPQDLARVGGVNRWWNNVSNMQHLWKKHCCFQEWILSRNENPNWKEHVINQCDKTPYDFTSELPIKERLKCAVLQSKPYAIFISIYSSVSFKASSISCSIMFRIMHAFRS